MGSFIYFSFISSLIGAEGSQRFLFLEKKYQWMEENTSSFLFVSKMTNWFGLWVMLPVMKNVFKISDAFVAIIAVLLCTVGMA